MNEAEIDLSGHYQVQRSRIVDYPLFDSPVLMTQYGWAKKGHETNWYDTKIEPLKQKKEVL